MSDNEIHTITTVRGALHAGSRAVGYYFTLDEAIDRVLNNALDINENGYYPYAVIETISPGIYSFPREELWFKWNHDKEQYEECPKPERFEKYVAWSLG